MLPLHSDAGANEQHNGNESHAATKCRADSPATANTGLGGGFEFIAAALPRHRDNSKQLSDAGVDACNGDTKNKAVTVREKNEESWKTKTTKNNAADEQTMHPLWECTKDRACLAQA